VTAAKPVSYELRREPRTWGEHLRRQRILRTLRQADVANEIGIALSTFIKWERGKCEPPVRYIPRITTFLGYCPWQPARTPGERFRQMRIGGGLTQRAAAASLGVDPATVTRWELGGRRPLVGYQAWLLVDAVGRRRQH
jgi:transcriptional regulator with XRE-family HTH domain